MKALLYKDIIVLKNNLVAISMISFFLIIAIISGNVDIAYLIASFGLIILFIKMVTTTYVRYEKIKEFSKKILNVFVLKR